MRLRNLLTPCDTVGSDDSRLLLALNYSSFSASSLVQSANMRSVLLPTTQWAGDSGWGQTDSEAVCSGLSYSRVQQPICVADRPLMQTAVTCGSLPLHGGVLN